MTYNKALLYILSAILNGIMLLISNLISEKEVKYKYIKYAEKVDNMISLFLTQGDNNGKQD